MNNEVNTPKLSIKRLTKSFDGIKAVDDLSITLPAGKITALIGPNGSGKTTVFNLISGLLRPCSGRVQLGDTDITSLPPHKIAKAGVGRTFQMIRLCSQMTVLENVMLAFHYRYGEKLFPTLFAPSRIKHEELDKRSSAMECLRLVQMEHKADAMGNELSHGQRRLVEMARALALKPKILLLDEPMSGLSPQAIDGAKNNIIAVKQRGVSILFIEHDMNVVSDISEHVVVLNHGCKIAEGTAEQVKDNPMVQTAYLGSRYIAS